MRIKYARRNPFETMPHGPEDEGEAPVSPTKVFKTPDGKFYSRTRIVRRNPKTRLDVRAWEKEYVARVAKAPLLDAAKRSGLQQVVLDGKAYGCEAKRNQKFSAQTDYIFRSTLSHPVLTLSRWKSKDKSDEMSVLEVADVNFKANLVATDVVNAFAPTISKGASAGSLAVQLVGTETKISGKFAHDMSMHVARRLGAAFILYEDAAELPVSTVPGRYSGFITANGKKYRAGVSNSMMPPKGTRPAGFYERNPGAHLVVPNFQRCSPLFWVIEQDGEFLPWLPLGFWPVIRNLYREYRELCIAHQRTACAVETEEYETNQFGRGITALTAKGTDSVWTDVLDRIGSASVTYDAVKAKEFEIHKTVASLLPPGAKMQGGCAAISYDGLEVPIDDRDFSTPLSTLKCLFCGNDALSAEAAYTLDTEGAFERAVDEMLKDGDKAFYQKMAVISPEQSDNAVVIYRTSGGGAAAPLPPMPAPEPSGMRLRSGTTMRDARYVPSLRDTKKNRVSFVDLC